MVSGIKKALLPLLVLAALAVGCEQQQPKPLILSGTIADIMWQDRYMICTQVYILKDDGTTVAVLAHGWPPAWKGMHGQFMFTENDSCGFEFVSAKEIK